MNIAAEFEAHGDRLTQNRIPLRRNHSNNLSPKLQPSALSSFDAVKVDTLKRNLNLNPSSEPTIGLRSYY